MRSGANPQANLDEAVRLVHEAASGGAEYVQLPEYFTYLGPASGNQAAAQELSGPAIGRLRALAAEHSLAIHAGSMLEPAPVPGKCYNTSCLIDRTGAIAGVYRKVHLFDVNVPGEVVEKESDSIVPGAKLCTVPLGGMRIGMTICFDLRFPELYRALALEGATILTVPAAFAVPTGRVHWEILLRARAIENHAFVLAAAQAGVTAEGIASYGHSLIIGPWGEVLAEGNPDKEDVLIADIDIEEARLRRSQIDVLGLRRPSLYALPAQ